jgi:methyl-accepting chemotaxis protein
MAEKKTHMGDDPLAWLAEEDSTAKKAASPPKRTRARRTSRKKTVTGKTEIELVEESFATLAPQGEELVSRFYEQLFEQNPKLAPLFDNVSVVGQQKKLLASLVLLVQNLNKPEMLKDYLLGLGARHMHYGVSLEQYQMFTDSLLAVMSEMMGKKWTAQVNDAWRNTLNNVTTIMLEAYEPVEADKMVTNKQAGNNELVTMRAAVDGATTALMMCDENRVITYANPAVISLLQNRLAELRKVFPGFNLKKLIGTNIDDFHKAPSLQAGILSDVDNLPYQAQIQLLDLHFDLNASAIVDVDGNYMGNLVEWKDITDQVNAENAIQALIKAAGAGQLEERIDSSSYSGFMKNIAEGINSILDTVLAPVQETIRVSGALSNGDLTRNMDGEYQGLFATLADALNDSVNKMAETVQDINEASTSISTAASEISEGNVDLSQRTEQQASSLEETASSMEELTSTVRQNSDNARQANQLAASSREQAEKGGSVIKEAIEAMSAISASSKKVTDIIGVIDEIAFQTNLLALNAAVEAARAGEQGRGFAVVASEVRNLAQRSASAAKEIKELINDSGEKVKEGSALVDESGRTLEEIVASSKKVGDIISEIAAAGAEQTQGIEQVTKAVGQMDEMTQQNAALVEQAAAASESLDDQGKSLQRLMSFFEVGGEGDTPEPVAAPKKVKAKPAAKKAKPKANVKPKPTSKPAPVADDDDDEWDEF